MIASGFQNAPVTRILMFGIVLSSVLVTITDSKYYTWIEIDPHLTRYAQYWRLLTWQLAYSNSTEVLVATMTLYQTARIVERLWGFRKFLSFILLTLPYTTLLPPLVTALVLRPLSFGRINYVPAGPTCIIFAILAQYYAAIPYIYKYRLSTTRLDSGQDQDYGLLLTSKFTSYILPLQLALAQLPGSAIVAALGWAIGVAYRREILPGSATARVPAWLVGADVQRERFDDLRRRMDGEATQATGVDTADAIARRRGVFGSVLEQLRT